MSGRLFGLGIGPGDPELITLKARRILARVPVIAYPAPEGGESLVRAIAAAHIPAGRTEIIIATPMAAERFPARDVYDRYAAVLAGHLQAGRDVAVLCEGDPFFYGSFMYLFERLAGDHPTEVVPGVSSLTAAAAAAGTPLVSRNETLVVLPAPLPEAELEARLARAEAAAILKVGRHLGKIRRVLARLRLDHAAHYVERATMANQRIRPLAEMTEEAVPYFSMVVVRRPERSPELAAATVAAGVPQGVALVVLGAAGLGLARRLQPVLPGSRVHGLAGRADEADVRFADATLHMRQLFAAGTPIVGICAAGILIRAVAPLLADKHSEPPLVAVAADGSVAVPLLGGHHGANRLADAIATASAGVAAVTTAGDRCLGLALDEPPPGWRVANPEAAKAVAAALLAGEPVALSLEAADDGWLSGAGIAFAAEATHRLRITERAAASDPCSLVLHPPVLAVGVGCERGADPDEVVSLVRTTLAGHGLAEGAVACIASVALKADEPAVHAAATALGVPARFFAADALEAQTPRLMNPSAAVFRAVGCHGVAEAAALAAAGTEASLIVAKTKTARATCAVARAARPIAAASVGMAQGSLAIVGIGPGDPAWRTAAATAALMAATDIVGLGLYLELIADLTNGKTLHSPPMTEEEARARTALDLAADGRRVALVGSGDAGIYGLASLVFELLDREDRAEWNRVALSVVPGITALQTAAARIGAAIGHDFCAVSLSDLLTPWPTIERRLQAAADGDFVVALYNPVSRRRRWQLTAARDILLARRPAETPVVLARSLGRVEEQVRVIRLADLQPEMADMLTLILIGSSHSRLIHRGHRAFVYTPRGYAAKRAKLAAGSAGDRERS